MTQSEKAKLIIIGIINNILVLFVMTAFIMWIWNWVQPIDYEFTYWKTLGTLYLLRLFYSTTKYNYFKTDEYKNKIKEQ